MRVRVRVRVRVDYAAPEGEVRSAPLWMCISYTWLRLELRLGLGL